MGKLTALSVQKLKETGYHLDERGLYLQVKSATSKSWIYRFTLNKKTRDMGLGSYPDVSLAAARELATRHRLVVKSGRDPISVRDAERAAISNLSFRECANQYIDLYKVQWKNTKHTSQWRNPLAAYAFPYFGDKSVSEVSKIDILAALEPIWNDKRETATRLRGRIKSVLDWAAARDYRVEFELNLWDQVAKALPSSPKKVEHHKACPYREVASVIRTVRDSGANDGTKNLLEFLILTVARSSEALNARWSEIHFLDKVRVIPADRIKAGKEHRIPLSLRCMEILEMQRNNGSEYIFVNSKGKTYSNMTLTKALKSHGYEFTVHGFRASFKEWSQAKEGGKYSYRMSELALAHSNPDKVAAAYDHSDLLEERRPMMEAWADFCAGK